MMAASKQLMGAIALSLIVTACSSSPPASPTAAPKAAAPAAESKPTAETKPAAESKPAEATPAAAKVNRLIVAVSPPDRETNDVRNHGSGYGRDGPYADKGGFDLIAQGFAGLMSITGEPGGAPMKTGNSVADINAGILAVTGILAAYVHKLRTGRGQVVDTSLMEAAMQANRRVMRMTPAPSPALASIQGGASRRMG